MINNILFKKMNFLDEKMKRSDLHEPISQLRLHGSNQAVRHVPLLLQLHLVKNLMTMLLIMVVIIGMTGMMGMTMKTTSSCWICASLACFSAHSASTS